MEHAQDARRHHTYPCRSEGSVFRTFRYSGQKKQGEASSGQGDCPYSEVTRSLVTKSQQNQRKPRGQVGVCLARLQHRNGTSAPKPVSSLQQKCKFQNRAVRDSTGDGTQTSPTVLCELTCTQCCSKTLMETRAFRGVRSLRRWGTT